MIKRWLLRRLVPDRTAARALFLERIREHGPDPYLKVIPDTKNFTQTLSVHRDVARAELDLHRARQAQAVLGTQR